MKHTDWRSTHLAYWVARCLIVLPPFVIFTALRPDLSSLLVSTLVVVIVLTNAASRWIDEGREGSRWY